VRAVIAPRRPQRPDSDAGNVRLAERVSRVRESGILVVLVVFVAVTTLVKHRFLDASNIQFVLVDTTVFALLALGETMVVMDVPVILPEASSTAA
jgi:rhamnose transport system permease protein